jgi:hypothetical protein
MTEWMSKWSITVRGKSLLRLLLMGLALRLALDRSCAQTTPPQAHPTPAQDGTIHGIVKSGNMPIPGASVSISVGSSSEKISTWTDVDGSYSAPVPSSGSYTVRVQMVAFANSTRQVVIDATHQTVQANFELILLSRSKEAPPSPEFLAGRQRRSADFKIFR